MTPVPSDNEEDEMPVMTVSDYKSRTGRPSTGREAIAWKPGGGRREDVVITRYGPKSHPMFRIERASEEVAYIGSCTVQVPRFA